ncbi:hypothetical protein [Erythrobacter aureus]|uniref:Uncharacterized protein n=1 Tax=Erythrobacter aureus TaxID=2182384 RepID=A0A345YIN8_9SPHN|nr:hypothetical protein [Erythrobacter aureus]AXK43790.1 hypothetical protein DVR09_15145 [Erythrobacter aureus]
MPEPEGLDEAYATLLPYCLNDGLAIALRVTAEDDEPVAQSATPIAKPEGHFVPHWHNSFPVEDLKPGDHVRHRDMVGYERIVKSVKPHPRGGVQVKTTPAWLYGNRCGNPEGKVLKAHITGYCDRWDGFTKIEKGR